jgi:hypothetical protein
MKRALGIAIVLSLILALGYCVARGTYFPGQ